MLTVIDRAKAGLVKHGAMLDAYRAEVPRGLLAIWITKEAGWDRFAVSHDPVLIECGMSQAPLATCRKLDADPFDLETGLWIAGREAVADARHWSSALDDCGNPEPWVDWVTPPGRPLWWLAQMPYSIGDGAIDHVLRCSVARAIAQGHFPRSFGLLAAVRDWLAVADLEAAHHKRHWGRQSGATIRERCVKHIRWLDEADRVSPLDGMPGGEPTMGRPPRLFGFPADLRDEAAVCANPRATTAQHKAALESVRAYVAKRRKYDPAPRPSLVHRALVALRPAAYRRRVGDTVA